MATRQRQVRKDSTEVEKPPVHKKKRSISEVTKDINVSRRQQYRADEQHRDRVKKRSRDSYRKDNPRKQPHKIAVNKVSADSKEVTHVYTNALSYQEVYNVREFAEYLGKSYFTIRRWIADGILPPAIYKHGTRGNPQYTVDEARVIAEVLNTHSKEYDYLALSHDVTINHIWQRVEIVRKSNDIYEDE